MRNRWIFLVMIGLLALGCDQPPVDAPAPPSQGSNPSSPPNVQTPPKALEPEVQPEAPKSQPETPKPQPEASEALPPSGLPKPGARHFAKVLWIPDGDTFQILWDGEKRLVRLMGVDTPEKDIVKKDKENYGDAILKADGYGKARDFLKGLVEGKDVVLVFSKTGDQIDNTSSKRLLAYVYVGETDVNAEICRQGYTYYYNRFPHDRRGEFGDLVDEAMQAKRGLWALRD